MRFDPSGLYAAFDRMNEAAASKGKTLADVQAKDFIFEERKQGRAIAPTPEELTQKAMSLGWRLKRKKGVTPAKELARRIRARGTYGKGWKIQKMTNEKFRIRIWLINVSTESEKVDEAHKTSDRAEKITGKRFKNRLDKMASQVMGVF